MVHRHASGARASRADFLPAREVSHPAFGRLSDFELPHTRREPKLRDSSRRRHIHPEYRRNGHPLFRLDLGNYP
jgi:hypothetical protein